MSIYSREERLCRWSWEIAWPPVPHPHSSTPGVSPHLAFWILRRSFNAPLLDEARHRSPWNLARSREIRESTCANLNRRVKHEKSQSGFCDLLELKWWNKAESRQYLLFKNIIIFRDLYRLFIDYSINQFCLPSKETQITLTSQWHSFIKRKAVHLDFKWINVRAPTRDRFSNSAADEECSSTYNRASCLRGGRGRRAVDRPTRFDVRHWSFHTREFSSLVIHPSRCICRAVSS